VPAYNAAHAVGLLLISAFLQLSHSQAVLCREATSDRGVWIPAADGHTE